MNFAEIIETLRSASAKTLTEAKALLSRAADALAASVGQLAEANTALETARQQLSAKAEELTAAQSRITELTASLNAAQETAATAVSGVIAQLAAAGVKVDKLEPEPLQAALKARIEGEAQTLLAARGIKPLPEQLRSAADPAAGSPSSDAQILATYEKMPAGPERIAFLEKHKDTIWRAQSGRA